MKKKARLCGNRFILLFRESSPRTQERSPRRLEPRLAFSPFANSFRMTQLFGLVFHPTDCSGAVKLHRVAAGRYMGAGRCRMKLQRDRFV